jgi:glycosyltransferase involved in cell wall biosynthesis
MDALINAGTERSMLDIAQCFSSDISVEVVYFYPRHELRDAYQFAGIQTHFADLHGRYDWLRGIHRLRKYLRLIQPDIVISSLMRANLISRIACLMEGIPLIGTFVNDTYGKIRLAELGGKGFLKFKIFWLFDKWTARIPAAYLSNSEAIAINNGQALGIPASRIHTIYRGRKADNIRPWLQPNTEGSFHFIAIGRLLKRKGFVELINAYARLLQNTHQVKLTIYGEGTDRTQLESEIRKRNLETKVKLAGSVPNAVEHLYDADCFVFPSWYEGFSGALIEAMMAGIPIIASDIPMNLEAVTHNKTARVFPVKNIEALASEMQWVMNHYEEAKVLGRAARVEALDRFDIQKIAKQYESVLKEILEKGKKR